MHSWLLFKGIDPQQRRVRRSAAGRHAGGTGPAQGRGRIDLGADCLHSSSSRLPTAVVLPSAWPAYPDLSSAQPHVETASTRSSGRHAGRCCGPSTRPRRFIRQATAQRAQAILRRHPGGWIWALIDWIWPRYHYQLGLDQALAQLPGKPGALEHGEWPERTWLQMPNYLHFIDSQPFAGGAPAAPSR